jgi:hypothetical protein
MTAERIELAAGIHANVPAAVYHADPCPAPSLSASIATKICLASDAHAAYAHPRLNVSAVHDDAEEYDIGTAAHALLLEGDQSRVDIIDAADWRTKAAKEARDTSYAAGRIPLLAGKWTAVQAMVAAARGQLDAQRDGGAQMFTGGGAEQTLIWQEPDGSWCRARLDYLRPVTDARSGAAYAIDDYKTTSASANPDTWTRSLFAFGADIQVAFYLRGLRALTDCGEDVEFRFAVQETFPPYALSVIALGPDAMVLAEKKVLYALEHWSAALASSRWPGYPQRTCYASLPPFIESAWLAKELR